MHDEHLLSEVIEIHTVYRYRGPGYVVGIPARDLTEADLAEIEEREGITAAAVEASGLYERNEAVEVRPFCGYPVGGGGQCRRRVSVWGKRCWQHGREYSARGDSSRLGDESTRPMDQD